MDKHPNPLCVALDYPLSLPDGRTVEQITLRRGTGKDIMSAQRQEPEDAARRELVLIALLTEEKLVPEDLEALDMADLAAVQAVFQSLFARKQRGLPADQKNDPGVGQSAAQ